MTRLPTAGVCACVLLLLPGAIGCRASAHCARPASATRSGAAPANVTISPQVASTKAPDQSVRQVAYPETVNTPAPEIVAPAFANQELSLPLLVEEVQSRNPSLQAMIAAWRAAAQRYPQRVSLDDPMFMAMTAPASFGSNNVESAYVLQGSQKLPWFGKRDVRGQQAQAEASEAYHDVRDSRQRLAEVTQIAFYEYYVIRRQLELNRDNLLALEQFRTSARAKYEANQVTQQDVLQVDVELAEQRRRQIELERMDRVAVAHINTLLRQSPDAPLPAPPRQLEGTIESPPVELLREMAVAQRPDLASLGARVRAQQADVALAYKQYYPDVEVFGRYDSFWQPASTQSDLRGQVGVNMNVPLYKKRLNAAVSEAEFRLAQRKAEYGQKVLDIQYEVQAAWEQLDESRRTVQLYEQQFLPAAKQNVDTARANYDAGKSDFLALILAQRQLIGLREKQQQAIADYHRRRAELERALGGPMPNPISEAVSQTIAPYGS